MLSQDAKSSGSRCNLGLPREPASDPTAARFVGWLSLLPWDQAPCHALTPRSLPPISTLLTFPCTEIPALSMEKHASVRVSSLVRRFISLDVTACISSALWKLIAACFCRREAGPFAETQQPWGSRCHLLPSAQARDLRLRCGGGLFPPPPAKVCTRSLSLSQVSF